MDVLRELGVAISGWLTSLVVPLAALLAGYFLARVLGTRKSGDDAGEDTGWSTPVDTAVQAHLQEIQERVEQLTQENRYLEQALAHRARDIELLSARMAEAAARDREELVRLQDELEADHRIGVEKARLIRSLESAVHRERAWFYQTAGNSERQRVSMSALQAALSHAKRAQASTEGRLARLREQLRERVAANEPQPAGAERVVERIVEIPVETIVYRDREIPVEVPIEVPVGFTPLPTAPAPSGLRPKYSEKRPSSS
jgi:hypothetical protein